MASRPLRVLVAHPSAQLYGSDRVLVESVHALADAGHTVLVVLGGDGPLRGLLARPGVEVALVATPVLRKAVLSPRGILGLAAEAKDTLAPARRLIRSWRPDVVYVNTVTVPIWLALARLHRVPALCHVHEAESHLPALVRSGLAAPLLLCRTVVANSPFSRDVTARAVPGLRRRIRVVYNGVPGPANPDPPRRHLQDPVRLVQVSRISQRKGTDVVVAATQILRDQGVDASLTLVGDVFPGNEAFAEQVRATVSASGLSGAVRFTGEVDDVWGELAAADIAVVASLGESFGNAAVEAQLARRPVVAAANPGLREIVRAGDNGELCEPGDADSLAAAVQRTIRDWPRMQARTERGRDEALERFSVQRYRDDIRAVVEHTAQGGIGTRGTSTKDPIST